MFEHLLTTLTCRLFERGRTGGARCGDCGEQRVSWRTRLATNVATRRDEVQVVAPEEKPRRFIALTYAPRLPALYLLQPSPTTGTHTDRAVCTWKGLTPRAAAHFTPLRCHTTTDSIPGATVCVAVMVCEHGALP